MSRLWNFGVFIKVLLVFTSLVELGLVSPNDPGTKEEKGAAGTREVVRSKACSLHGERVGVYGKVLRALQPRLYALPSDTYKHG